MLKRHLKNSLRQMEADNLIRTRKIINSAQDIRVKIDSKEFLNFTSNDYLGLANHPKLKEAMIAGVKLYGIGAGASHLITGHSRAHHQLETEFARFLGTEKALLFSSGYMANLGVLDALGDGKSFILQDKLNHASLLDGARLARADSRRYAHNDIEALEKLLKANQEKNTIIVSDSVFSMDGDIADIKALENLAARYSSCLYLDEAHGFGVLGAKGRGAFSLVGKGGGSTIIMATFGKALATYGATVAGDSDFIEYLMQKARSYIYTTALPPAIAHASLFALKLLEEADDKRVHLQKLIRRFRSNMQDLEIDMPASDTPIQPLMCYDNKKALQLADELYKSKILVQAIRPPTVPKNAARIRIALSASHSLDDVDLLSETIKAKT